MEANQLLRLAVPFIANTQLHVYTLVLQNTITITLIFQIHHPLYLLMITATRVFFP